MNATINRELEHLRRAFKLGFEEEPKLVMQPLKVPRLEEDNIREMTITLEQYLILRNGLPEPYQTFFVCGYHLGTREGELIKLQWSEVDLDKNEILLKRYTTKIKEPRVLPIYGEMGHFLKMAKERRDRLYRDCPWVFNRKGKRFGVSFEGVRKLLITVRVMVEHPRSEPDWRICQAVTNRLRPRCLLDQVGKGKALSLAVGGFRLLRQPIRHWVARRDRPRDFGRYV